ncbi:hypothetical protein [Clostridium massiliamazoniense]|uniref:hypothetical protein n=1 Tax=Clostridium massiliamazoniense TaxID=1347366 RepID=UPI0006D7D305|nr:hypothetical protein [Clostridium massiliamazoniense]
MVKLVSENIISGKEYGRITVDGVVVNNVDLSKGINIGCIRINKTVTIKYSVIVKNRTCNGKITNILEKYFLI